MVRTPIMYNSVQMEATAAKGKPGIDCDTCESNLVFGVYQYSDIVSTSSTCDPWYIKAAEFEKYSKIIDFSLNAK